MASQASTVSVYDAGTAREVQLGRALMDLEDDYQDAEQLERSLCNLHFGLEAIGLLPDDKQGLTVQAYVQEAYGLANAGLDPLLAPFLPAIPSQGSLIITEVLAGNGFVVKANGFLVRTGARLAPRTTPAVFDTSLAPGGTAGAFSYNGQPDSVFSFNMVGGAQVQPNSLTLYLNNQQVGHIDYPPAANGQVFSWTQNGRVYYGSFDTSSTRYDLLP